jgi:hypothetical protein
MTNRNHGSLPVDRVDRVDRVERKARLQAAS